MSFKEKLSEPKAYLITFVKWSLFGLLMGVWGGLLGAGFHHLLRFVTHLRTEHTWLIFGLPVGGLLSVGVYHIFRQRSNRGTNEVIDAVLSGGDVSAYIHLFALVCVICFLLSGHGGLYSSPMHIFRKHSTDPLGTRNE